MTAPVQAAPDSPEARYWRAMTEIKYRLAAIDALYAQELQMPKDQGSERLFAWEQIALHLRKCMELIVFSSLVAHEDAYRKVYPDLADHWRISKILKRLDGIHPAFFPVAAKISTTGPGQHHAATTDEAKLTRADLEWLYDKCADLIHAFQPFKHQGEGPIQIDFKHTPHQWTRLIWNLLEEHFVVLLGQNAALLVQMAAPPHGRVKVMTGEPADTP